MPLPALALAGLQLAGQAGSGIINQIFARDAEKRQQNYNTRVYEQQRNDALKDWQMQNDYNSPQAVMRRYKEAGLNPNLIYGNGTTASAGPVRQSQQGSFTPQVQRVEPNMIGDAVNQYYNVQRQKAEIDNLHEQNQQIKASTNLLTWKAITEGQMPEYLRAKTEVEKEKPSLIRNQASQAFENYNMTNWLRAKDKSLFPIEQKIKEQTLNNLKATLGNIQANTNYTTGKNTREQTLLPSILHLNLEKIISERMNQSKSSATIKHLSALINKLNNDATQTELDGGVNLGFLGKWGTYGKSKGLFYNSQQMKNVEDIMRGLDADWDKKSQAEKNRILNNLSKTNY